MERDKQKNNSHIDSIFFDWDLFFIWTADKKAPDEQSYWVALFSSGRCDDEPLDDRHAYVRLVR